MARKKLPKTNIDIEESTSTSGPDRRQLRRMMRRSVRLHNAKKTRGPRDVKSGVKKVSPDLGLGGQSKPKTPKTIPQPQVTVPSDTVFDRYVAKVNSITDVKKLKKMIYNRNYQIKKTFLKQHPDIAEYHENIKVNVERGILHPSELRKTIVQDVRYTSGATYKRINKIKDPDKLLSALRKLLIDNTRRSNRPKTIRDYSNREREYMDRALSSLQDAISNFPDEQMSSMLEGVVDNITPEHIHEIFRDIPSYWAVSNGYYYNIEDFDGFMEGVFRVVESVKDSKGEPLVELNSVERKRLSDLMLANSPRDHTE